ncbi:class I SAM-dependent DNA methyltransferase [Amorphus orientalis]|uniref:SAM-dependent methyltransferase n=1 Tax=Amorphus orientalis TaxID=649198 RepID=A0AAE4ASI6_9HYPH|nr:class I SAM-dependent methyltransferase [Amorphus orientalis]MDQ0315075.1 SAM-dependent methyltransferase [Amorphus orientalis]
MTDLTDLAGQTQAVYERNARRFDAERPKILFERAWLERFLEALPAQAAILDLGCGSGDPIARFLTERGCRVTGIDASSAMIALAREKQPAGDWRVADMRALDLAESFDGIIGWDSFFHLTRDEQRAVLALTARHLRPGGALMLTVGPEDGEVEGRVGDDRVYHSSLSETEYRALLAEQGLSVTDFVAEDPRCDFHTVLLARKTDAQAG